MGQNQTSRIKAVRSLSFVSVCRVTLSLLLKVYKLVLSEYFQDLRPFKTTPHFIYRQLFWVNTFADSCFKQHP